MTAVRFADSLKYGVVIFGYFVGVTVLGLGGIALGAFLAVPELSSWLDGNGVGQAALAGGVVLMTLGAAVWFTGLFGIARKLLADAVSAGVADGQGDITVRLPASDTGGVTEPTRTVRREGRTKSQSDRSGTATTKQEASVEDVRSDASTAEEMPSSASGSGAEGETGEPAQPGGGVPRTEAEAGERGWSVTEGRGNDDQPVEGPTGQADERAQNREGDGDGTEPKQTAEEIAFGNARGEDVEPVTGEQDEDEPDTTVEPGSDEAAADSDGDGGSDPFVDRPTDE
ncbi:MAG: hypothetical protein V5A55_07470 [Halovenus sp.]